MAGPIVANGLERARGRLSAQNALDLLAVERLIAQSMDERVANVLALVVFFQSQNEAGVKAAILGILPDEPGKKLLRAIAQSQKCRSDRFESVPVAL